MMELVHLGKIVNFLTFVNFAGVITQNQNVGVALVLKNALRDSKYMYIVA